MENKKMVKDIENAVIKPHWKCLRGYKVREKRGREWGRSREVVDNLAELMKDVRSKAFRSPLNAEPSKHPLRNKLANKTGKIFQILPATQTGKENTRLFSRECWELLEEAKLGENEKHGDVSVAV